MDSSSPSEGEPRLSRFKGCGITFCSQVYQNCSRKTDERTKCRKLKKNIRLKSLNHERNLLEETFILMLTETDFKNTKAKNGRVIEDKINYVKRN
jgi:hypothetical protein